MWPRPNSDSCHPDDQSLLAYLDGELPSSRTPRVAEHISACWRCRTRLSEMESAIEEFTSAFTAPTFPTGMRREENRRRLFDQAERIARQWPVETPGFPYTSLRSTALATALAAAVFLLAVALHYLPLRRPTPAPSVTEVVRRLREREVSFSRSPFHQKLRVRLEQLAPSREAAEGELELWSDPHSQRSLARWRDAAGATRRVPRDARADNAPEQTSESLQSAPTLSAAASRSSVVAEFTEHLVRVDNLREFEQAFFSWLKQQPARPLLFSSALLVSDDKNTRPRVELSKTSGPHPKLSLSATRSWGTTSAELIIEVDPATYRVNRQEIVVRKPLKTFRLVLVSENIERVKEPLRTPWMEDPSPSESLRRSRRAAPDPPPLTGEAQGETLQWPESDPSSPELRAMEISLYYELHALNACTRDAIKVAVSEEGALEVSGVVAGQLRRNALLAAMKAEQLPDWVHLNLKTHAEYLQLHPQTPNTRVGEVHVDAEAGAKGAARSILLSRIESYLTENPRLFPAGEGRRTDLQARTAAFRDTVIASSSRVLANSWAVRRLVEQFFPSADGMDAVSSRRLEAMLADHLREMRSELERVNNLLEKPLAGLHHEPPGEAAPTPNTASLQELGLPMPLEELRRHPWALASWQIFTDVSHLHRLLGTVLITSHQSGAEASNEAGSSAARESKLRRLAALLSRLEQDTQTARRQIQNGLLRPREPSTVSAR